MTFFVPGSATTIGTSRKTVVLVAALCVSSGTAVGYYLPAIARFASRVPIPLDDVFRTLETFDSPGIVYARPLIGAMVGLLAAVILIRNAPRVTIDPYAIVVDRHIARPLQIPRTSVATAYVDHRGKLTILGTDGQPAFAGDVDGKEDRVEAAFRAHGYHWGRP